MEVAKAVDRKVSLKMSQGRLWSTNKNEPLLSCININKVYGKDENTVTVLKNISLNIFPNEFVAIVGPSGSGKSTLMHILGALDTPTTGSYTLNGQVLSDLDEDTLAEIRNKYIGFVFQSFYLLPRTSAYRNVQLALIYNNSVPKKEREERINNALIAAGFDLSKASNQSNQLSGGQIQRVAIARALVTNPSILLADEPTGNLDQETGRIVLSTLQRLHKEDHTIVLITHDMNVARYASRIIKIEDGNIISDNTNMPFIDKPSAASNYK